MMGFPAKGLKTGITSIISMLRHVKGYMSMTREKKTHMELLEITNMIAEMKSTLDGINIKCTFRTGAEKINELGHSNRN